MFHRMMNYGELEPRPSVVLTRELIKKNMPRYKRHGDLVVIQEAAWEDFKKSLPMPVVKDENSPFSVDEDELAYLVCRVLPKPDCKRLAVDKGVRDDDFRTPIIELILGDHGIVSRKDNHVTLEFDITKCMYSFGNINEKMRMAKLDCSNEIVVDLFVGIGYFSLQLLVHARAKHLYACEWNEEAIKAFRRNLKLNKIEDSRCTIIEGDNRINRPLDVAQRVIMGILPSCIDWMQTAFECIDKTTGAILHCHDLVECKPPEEPESSVGPGKENAETTQDEPTQTTASEETKTEDQSDNKSHLTDNPSPTIDTEISSDSPDKTPKKDSPNPSSTDSDKDSSPPVLLEKPSPSEYPTEQLSISPNVSSSSCSNRDDISINESIQVSEREINAYEARAQILMSRIKNDVESHDLTISLLHIEPVKSYAPHVNHVVFDIQIAPKSHHHPTSVPEIEKPDSNVDDS